MVIRIESSFLGSGGSGGAENYYLMLLKTYPNTEPDNSYLLSACCLTETVLSLYTKSLIPTGTLQGSYYLSLHLHMRKLSPREVK